MVTKRSIKDILKMQHKKISTETMELAAQLLPGTQGQRFKELNEEITNFARIIDSNSQRVNECERALNPERDYITTEGKSEAARAAISSLKKYYEEKVAQAMRQCEPLIKERSTLFEKAALTSPEFAFHTRALTATRWAEYAKDLERTEVKLVVRKNALQNAAEAENLYMRAIRENPEQKEIITKRQTKMRIAIGKSK